MTTAIAYYRTAKDENNRSKQGLIAQKTLLREYAQRHDLTVIADFIEVENARNRWPQLQKAISECQRQGSQLLIARIGKLGSNVPFLTQLKDSNLSFVAIDMPEINQDSIEIVTGVAEKLSAYYSQNTKEALAAAKARGVSLGSPGNLTHEARQRGASAKHHKAIESYEEMIDHVCALRSKGMSLRAICVQLNTEGHKTSKGYPYSVSHVQRLLKYAEELGKT